MIKKSVHQVALNEVQKRLEELNNALRSTTDAVQNETKSSAGDKHETARAMAHLEQEKLAQQIQVTKGIHGILDQLNAAEHHTCVQFGSLVQLDSDWYYFSAGIGKISVDQQPVFCLSIVTPLGKILSGKKEGDMIQFNGSSKKIHSIS